MKTDPRTLQVGQQVYYTGDMANNEAWCVITERVENPQWGLHYNMVDEDDSAHEFRGIKPMNFEGPGRRFQIKEEYDAERATKMAQMRTCLVSVASANRTN